RRSGCSNFWLASQFMCAFVHVFLPAGYQRPWRSRNADTCWRFERRSITAVSRARVRSRIASCRRSGTHTAVSSPARSSFARLTASRRLVFTRSPRFFGISAMAQPQRTHGAECFDLSMELVTRGTCLVAECDPLVFGFELTNQLGRRRGAVLDLAQKT